jgi:hypothetical protein
MPTTTKTNRTYWVTPALGVAMVSSISSGSRSAGSRATG